MSDLISTSENTKNNKIRQEGEDQEPTKPIAPMWIFKVMNPFMKALLRSPLHSRLSDKLMLLSYKGRRSGKVYTNPVGYFPWADGEVITFTSGRWFINVRNHQPVILLMKRRRVLAIPTVIEEREAVLDTVAEFVKRLGLATAQQLPLGLPRDRQPERADLEAIRRGIVFVVFKIAKSS